MSDIRLDIHVNERTKPLGDLFGIFFEDLNHAADGGLYAEMVQNRSFEFCAMDNPAYHELTTWEAVGNAGITVQTAAPLHGNNPHYLSLSGKAGAGVVNLGFGGGMVLEKDGRYRFSCWARAAGTVRLDIRLTDPEAGILAWAPVACQGEWRKYEVLLSAPGSSRNARLSVTLSQDGEICLDEISLFPTATFKGRANGMRADLAQALADLKPKFMCFPGGCLVHDGTLNADDRDSMYRWKNTIGPVEQRPARRSNWVYNQTLGLGFYEYFQFCEDIGAKPLPVLPGGCDPHHRRFASMDELQPWIDDALDLIEFANGGADTVWGAKRAEMGHPAPFGLEYIAIGNEEVHREFYDRFPYFARAIRARYPEIKIIGSGGPYPAGGEYERGWRCARETGIDLVDEHYYESPAWLVANADHYMDYPADGPKVFLGEYVSGANLVENALCEAVYMIGLMNAPAVGLACYAPMLCHKDYVNWDPNLIWFDNAEVLLTANYHVQALFMRHQGDALLRVETEHNEAPAEVPQPLHGPLSLEADGARMLLTDIRLAAPGLERRFFDASLSGHERVRLADIDLPAYTLTLRAKRLEGEKKGFRIIFGERDEQNLVYWSFGGWENQDTLLAARHNGRNAPLTQSQFSIETGRAYDLRLEVEGRRARTYIDGVLVNEACDRLPAPRPLYVTASAEDATGDVILKTVNVRDEAADADIRLAGLPDLPLDGVRISLSGYPPDAKNTFDAPHAVEPAEEPFHADGLAFRLRAAARSVTVLRLKTGK